MTATAVYSTRLKKEKRTLLRELQKQTGFSERQILEKAIELFNKEIIKQNIKNSYKNLANNEEIIKLTEMGLEDLSEL